MTSTSLQKHDQTILQNQSITDDSPGTVLRDFDTLLAFIGPAGIEVSGKYKFLPIKRLAELNARLSKPIELDLKRPQQKSYPPIHGLYLLLRASGLAIVKQRGKKNFLHLDEQGLASWHGLNPSERYFTLLESWLLRSNPSILGESESFGSGSAHHWESFIQRFPGRSLQIANNPNAESMLSYRPTFCTLALLELFGFVNVRHVKPKPGKGWRVEYIERTDFGDALLRLLSENEFLFELFFPLAENEAPLSLHDKLKPYFPEWRNNLTLSEPEHASGLYIFKVSLGSVWARIAISSASVLDTLSSAILNAYGFDFDHLYRFTHTNRYGIAEHIHHPYMEGEPPWADEVTISELGLTPGMSMVYLYDFGDNWQFEVLLESIEPTDGKIKQAKLIEFHGEAPPQYGDYDDDW